MPIGVNLSLKALRNLVYIRVQIPRIPLKKGDFEKTPVPPFLRGARGKAVSFSCRGGAPVPAPVSETQTKSWMKRVGTGALPLQNDDLPENETALGAVSLLHQPRRTRQCRVPSSTMS